MVFRQILLQIFHKLQNERTISATYYLLKGKQSGQTIQDVGYFKLHAFFRILPKLSRAVFDEEIKQLHKQGYLLIREGGYYELTQQAYIYMHQAPPHFFDGWRYRGNEYLFFARLLLLVQSLSHQQAQQMSFSPIIKEESIQAWVRAFLHACHYQSGTLQRQLLDELQTSLQQAKITTEHRDIIVYRLSGYHLPGWTWQQLAKRYEMEPLDIQLLFIEGLHQWLACVHAYPLLQKIAEGVRIEGNLTGSAKQTAQLFWKGYSIEQMSYMRQLRPSTIEDHLVELALHEPNFPFDYFISEKDIQRVYSLVQTLKTKKLKILHEADPSLTYFQLKLALAKGGV